jgi:hypothetical protein
MAYKDMFTVLVVDSRIERSQYLRDAPERILGHLRDDHHLRTDVLRTTRDVVIRLRNDASVACLLLESGGKTADIDGQRVLAALEDIGLEIPVFLLATADDLAREQDGLRVEAVRGLIGAALAIVGYLAWPSWEGESAQAKIARLACIGAPPGERRQPRGTPARVPGGYPARAGGLWLRSTLVRSRFHAVVVPSGLRTRVKTLTGSFPSS